MTVAELIAELQKHPQDLSVTLFDRWDMDGCGEGPASIENPECVSVTTYDGWRSVSIVSSPEKYSEVWFGTPIVRN